jgi:hypothetical protein
VLFFAARIALGLLSSARWWETAMSLAGVTMQAPLILLIALVFKLDWLHNDPQSLSSVSLGFCSSWKSAPFF